MVCCWMNGNVLVIDQLQIPANLADQMDSPVAELLSSEFGFVVVVILTRLEGLH